MKVEIWLDDGATFDVDKILKRARAEETMYVDVTEAGRYSADLEIRMSEETAQRFIRTVLDGMLDGERLLALAGDALYAAKRRGIDVPPHTDAADTLLRIKGALAAQLPGDWENDGNIKEVYRIVEAHVEQAFAPEAVSA